MMQTAPYSIYVDKRPLKVAFLISPSAGRDLIQRVITYNHGKWGGRYNPIILCDGSVMSDRWWAFLSAYDPDVIRSFVPLSDPVVERIEHSLSPYHVEPLRTGDDTDARVRLHDEGLSILPTLENTAQLSPWRFDKPELILFEVDKSADPVLKEFIRANLGMYACRTSCEDQALSHNVVRSLQIGDRNSMSSALQQITALGRFAFPAQICSLPNSLPDTDRDNTMSEAFTVVVGDSVEDMVYAWNRMLLVPKWQRNALPQMWLPVALARDNGMEAGLKSWIRNRADPGGTMNQSVDFVTFSLQQEELEEIADRLTDRSWLVKRTHVLDELPLFNPDASLPFVSVRGDMDLYRAVGEEESISLKEPQVQEGGRGGECWVADVYIELKSKLFENRVGSNQWYKLPRRNALAYWMFGRPSRIGRNGLPSVIVTRPSALINRMENELHIRLLDGDSVLGLLVAADNFPFHGSRDPREKFTSRPFCRAAPSDKGRYLTGLLELFSGLFNAHYVLECRYWRNMFAALSAQDPAKGDKKEQDVINMLRKKPREYLDEPEGLEWLALRVLHLARTVSVSSKELSFDRFFEEARKESDEYSSQNEPKIAISRDNVRRAITRLMECGVLIAGIRSYCPSCGIANWHRVDDVCQTLSCIGCNREFPLRAEEKWYYRLNHLVLSGYAHHGLAPVVLVLGQMLRDSRTSFMMSPSLSLYDEPERDPVCELDIVCVQDGKLVIGEVKNRVGLFHPSDFEKMEAVAARLRPDRVIFSSLDEKPSRLVTQGIDELRDKLADSGTEVEWYQLYGNIFKPSPVI